MKLAVFRTDARLLTGRTALFSETRHERAPDRGTRRTATTLDDVPLPPAFGETFTPTHIDTGEVRLHAVMGGTGPPILLIHGWPQTWYAWRLIMPALATSSMVIAPDIRGAGRSGKPLHGYDAATLAADLVKLMERLGYLRFTVVGHDVGAWIGYAIAADHPEHVEQLAVVEGLPPGVGPAVASTYPIPATVTRHYARELLNDADVGRSSFAHHRCLDITIAQNRRRLERPLSMPVLAIGGESSLGERVPAAMRRAATEVTEAVIPDCGHYPAEERPDALIAVLLRSLRRS